jgi:hypothetical protein
MAQSRRPSTTKHTPRQNAAELPDTLKNIQSLVASMATSAKPVRRQATQRSENQHSKLHLKEVQPKSDSQNIKASDATIPENDGKDPAISHTTTTVKSVRHVEAQRDGKRVVYSISLPAPQMLDVRHHLKQLGNRESSHDLGLASKGYLSVHWHTLTVVCAETAETLDLDCTDEKIAPPCPAGNNHLVGPRAGSLALDPRMAHGSKTEAENGSETQQRGRKLMRAASIGPRTHKLNDMSSLEASDVASSESAPKETAMPPLTPKRQIRLATSNSRAAEWFATGPTYSGKKKESTGLEIPIAEIQPPPPSEDTHEQFESPNVPETTMVNLLEPFPVENVIGTKTSESTAEKIAGACVL